jgi:hypothetical protein
MSFRTDRHNNPIAFSTDVAKQGGLKLGVDYEKGEPFKAGKLTLYTAKLLGDPVALTIRVINQIGFFTAAGAQRWSYMDMPDSVWRTLDPREKRWLIGHMYKEHERGTAMRGLF